MIIFDFDGILIDSVHEVAVTAYNTVTGSLALSLEELPHTCLNSFVRNRFHFQPAGDVLPLMEWCLQVGGHKPEQVLSAAEYANILAGESRAVKERTMKFFSVRKLFVERDRKAWTELNRPYEPLWSVLREKGAERVVILTNKNRQAVIDLTSYYGLSLEPENVYAGDHGKTKKENLLAIHSRFLAEDYLFVDDSIGNLRELREEFLSDKREFNLQLALGTWGYLGPDDITDAQAEGIPIMTQSDVISILDEELP